jgi:hypothetical protein
VCGGRRPSRSGHAGSCRRKTRHTTHLKDFPATVCVRCEHDPLLGESLLVYGWMRRHGRLDLILVLPDGSKSLVPGSWTDLGPQIAGAPESEPSGGLASVSQLLRARAVVLRIALRKAAWGCRCISTAATGAASDAAP